MKLSLVAAAALAILTLAPGQAQTTSPISIDTSNPIDWKISNGVLTVDWLPGTAASSACTGPRSLIRS